jgi:chaperone BCS1
MQHAVFSHMQSGLRTGHPVADAVITSVLFGILTYLTSNLVAWCNALTAMLTSKRPDAKHATSRLVVPMMHWALNPLNGLYSTFANLDYTALVWYLTSRVPVSRGVAITTRVISHMPTILPYRQQTVKFQFEGHPMEYSREYDTVKVDEKDTGNSPMTLNERVEITVAVDRGVPLLTRLMEHVRSEKAVHDSAVTWVQHMYRLVKNGKPTHSAKPTHSSKTFDTVVLEADMQKEIVADLRAFLDGEKWYASMGLAYKRGYLLHGPPGTGKSSMVLAISNMAAANIYHMNLSLIRNDADLDDAFATMPNKCVVVFEDIDCMGAKVTLARACEPRKKKATVCDENDDNDDGADEDYIASSALTLSCLLNHLDGTGGNHGRIFVMTTNHPELLDPALVRPGRADVHLRLGLCSRLQIRTFFGLFYPNETAPPEQLATLPDNTLSPAEVSCTMLQFRNDPVKAVERLARLAS